MKKRILTPYNTSSYTHHTKIIYSECSMYLNVKDKAKLLLEETTEKYLYDLEVAFIFLKQTQKLLLTKKKADKSTTLKFGNSTYEKTKHTQEHYGYNSKPQSSKIYLQYGYIIYKKL